MFVTASLLLRVKRIRLTGRITITHCYRFTSMRCATLANVLGRLPTRASLLRIVVCHALLGSVLSDSHDGTCNRTTHCFGHLAGLSAIVDRSSGPCDRLTARGRCIVALGSGRNGGHDF